MTIVALVIVAATPALAQDITGTPGAPGTVPGGVGGTGGYGVVVTATGAFSNSNRITGGIGGKGGDNIGPHNGGAGGTGGGGALSTATAATFTNFGIVIGGNGGPGGNVVIGFGGAGGVGGAGGAGVQFTASDATFINFGTVAGGDGGAGGTAPLFLTAFGVVSGDSAGGAGGVGAQFTASNATFANSGTVTGGNGGGGNSGGLGAQFTASSATFANFRTVTGGNGGVGLSGDGDGGNGARGGVGVQFTAVDAAFSNSGTVSGGKGGEGGPGLGPVSSHSSFVGKGGTGGTGGAGVQFTASGGTVTNSGTITGGNGGSGGSGGSGFGLHGSDGAPGAGGVGIVGAGLTIINTGTISGGLSGDGGTRANAVAFTGGSNILELQAGSTILGNVIAFSTADTFRLGGTANASFDVSQIGSQYQGFGIFEKTGSSTWSLTGTNALAMPWTVNAGTLAVNGSIAGAVTVNNGGTLGGNGTTGPVTVATGGTLAPGNSIGTITINGNLVFGAGSIYRVELSTNADRTNVIGIATLAGTAQLVFQSGQFSHTYTILSAAGGHIGTFDAVTTQNIPAVLSTSLSYVANDVVVTLTSNIAQLAGLTPNQKAVAGAQGFAFNNGLSSISALFGLAAAEMPAALDQLSGEAHASTAGVLADESLYVRSAILGRLRQVSYGGDMGAMAALNLGGQQAAFADGRELNDPLAYAKSPIVTKAPVKALAVSRDVVFWAQGFGAWGRFDGEGNAATVRRDLTGLITGVDTRLGANGRAGLAAGYTSSRNTLHARGAANVETGHVAAYGGWSFGAFNLRGGTAYAFHSIDTDRMISFPGFFDRATARYDGGTGQIFGEAGYGFAFGSVSVEPFAGAAWVRVQTGSVAERALLAGLDFAGTTFETGYSTLGLRAVGMVPVGDMMLIPRGSLTWQHAFNNVTPDAVLAFQAAPAVPFTISGVPIARDAALAEAGLDLAINSHATIGVSYIGQIASNVRDHAAKGKFSWRF